MIENMIEKKITFDRFIRGLLTVLFVLGAFWLLNRLSGALLPFFIAWLIAYFLYPLVKLFQYKLRFRNRAASIVAAMLTVAGVLTVAGILFIPDIVAEFVRLKELLAEYFTKGSRNNTIPEMIGTFVKENIDINYLQQIFSEENLFNAFRNAVPEVWNILYRSVDFLFSIVASFIILLYIFFILLDYEAIAEGWIKLVPSRHRKFVQAVANDVQVSMNRYFRGQALVAFLVGILFCIGFLIIDFPLAIGFGLFIGLLNMVPYLQLVAFIPTILLALLKAADTGENFWWILLSALLVFCIVQLIQDGFIVPKVMGKITGLNPAIILLSLSVWGSLLGILGMIIALPLTTLIVAYYNQYLRYEERVHTPQPPSSPTEEAEIPPLPSSPKATNTAETLPATPPQSASE